MWNCFKNIKAKGHLTSMGSVSSVTQSCLTLCVSMECSMPGFPVHHQFPKVAQKHVCQVYDDIQPSHPWLSPSPPVFSFFPASGSFQMSCFFASSGQSIGVWASVLVLQMNIDDWFPWGLTGLISLQSKELSRVFSNTIVQKHHSSMLSFLYSPTLLSIHDYWKNHGSD